MWRQHVATSMIAVFVLTLLPFLAQPTAAQAIPPATRFVAVGGTDGVNDCTDPLNPCATIQHAHDQATAGETIGVEAGTYAESGIVIDQDIAVVGAGRTQTIIDAGGVDRHFDIVAGATQVTIQAMTLENGLVATSGGAVRVESGDVRIRNVRLRDNNADFGGAVSHVSTGELIVRNSRFARNQATGSGGAIWCDGCGTIDIRGSRFHDSIAGASGGAIYMQANGTTTIETSLFHDNNADQGGAIYSLGRDVVVKTSTLADNEADMLDGGAIFQSGDLLEIRRSTLARNSAPAGAGGGIDLVAGELGVVDSTFSSNTALVGGALSLEVNTTSAIYNSTFYGNSATFGGGGGAVFGGGLGWTLTNSIITASTNGDCSSVVTAPLGENNLIDDLTCGSGATFTLGPVTDLDTLLQSNGGPTNTHALLAGSNAIDAGANNCPGLSGGMIIIDQRGTPRPLDGDGDGVAVCDIGAFELQ